MFNDSYLAFETTDLSEAKEYSSMIWEGKRNLVLEGPDPFRTRTHSAPWGRIRLSHVATEGQLTVACDGGPSGYILQFLLAGQAEVFGPQREARIGPGDLLIASNGTSSTTRFSGPANSLVVSCDRDVLDGQLEVLLDRPIKRPIEFQPLLSFRSRPGQYVYRFVRFMIDELNQAEPFTNHSPGTARQIETGLYSLILESVPHSYSGQMRKLLVNGTRKWRWPFSLN
jgi:AraC-binding-like domain